MFLKGKKKKIKIDKPRTTNYANKNSKKIYNNVWKINDKKRK